MHPGRRFLRPVRHPDGIGLQATSDIVISGNQFSGLSGQAVVAEGQCRRILVTGNIVTDYGRRLKDKKPAIDLGKASASIAKDNVVGIARRMQELK